MAWQAVPRIAPDAGGRREQAARRLPVVLVLAAVAVAATGPGPLLAGPLAIAVVSADLVRVDLRSHRLPNALVLPCYPAALVGIALNGVLTGSSPLPALASGTAWFAFFLVMNAAGGMGMGDVKLAGVLGLCLGALGIGVTVAGILLAFLFGGIAGVVVLARRVGGSSTRIPFGPFLLAGFWVALAVAPMLR